MCGVIASMHFSCKMQLYVIVSEKIKVIKLHVNRNWATGLLKEVHVIPSWQLLVLID